MSNPWFRLYTEAVDDEKLRLLAFEDRWHFVAILCCKAKGILDEKNKGLLRRKVAVKLGLDVLTLDEVSRRLAEVGLIDEKTLEPVNWSKRQFVSDSDPTRNERKKRYRSKQKESGTDMERTWNGHGTHVERSPDTDTDTDTDTETETETEKEALVLYQPVVPLTQVSNAPNSVSTCASARTHTRGAHDDPRFEEFWSVYPKRNGSNSKSAALKAWTARIREKHQPEEMIEGAIRYAGWCEASGKVATEFVQQAATFLGKQKNFMERWDVGRSLNNQMKTAHMKVERLAQDSVFSTNNWVFNQTATIEGVCYEN